MGIESKEKEKCIICKRKTEYTKDTPIEMRCGYVEGAGQLCLACCREIYEAKPKSA